jgi:hypothetical protein
MITATVHDINFTDNSCQITIRDGSYIVYDNARLRVNGLSTTNPAVNSSAIKIHIKRIVAEYRREKNQELISNTVISINKDNK